MELYPHQREGVTFLARKKRAYLADGMGLGKTIQAARAAEVVGANRVLVVAPASTLPNWEREWARWNRYKGCEVTFTSYARVKRHASDDPYDLVVLDEAHYVKNPRAKRTKSALLLAARAERAWLLSGTPMPNNPTELWAPLKALWPDRVGQDRYRQFLDYYCKWYQSDWGPRIYGMKHADELVELLRPIMLRRTDKDVADGLPPLRVDVSLLPKDAVEPELWGELEPELDAVMRRLEMEEADPEGSLSRVRRLVGTLKAPAIAQQIATELEEGAYQKIVVLCYHHDTIDRMSHPLRRFGVVGFTGKTSPEQRQHAIDTFMTDPEARVFLGQQTAAGTGINLQVATEIVLVEPSWSPADNFQAIKRIHRIGQDNPCRARMFGLADSIDSAIVDTLAVKTRMQSELGLAGA